MSAPLHNPTGHRSPLSKVIVLAPHPDDELIGCYLLLESRQVDYVAYFNDLTNERKAEARKCGAYYGFEPIFVQAPSDRAYLEGLLLDSIVLLPSITDEHPEHKDLNAKYRAFPGLGSDVSFYHVDMGPGKSLLSDQSRAAKRKALDTFYPSQCQLWENNASYYLFEHVSPRDYTIFTTLHCETCLGACKVRLPPSARSQDIRDALLGAKNLDGMADALIGLGVFSFELETGYGEVIKL